MGGFYIDKCPRIVPFLENNGPRPLAGPRSILFKEWSDTRTFSYTYAPLRQSKMVVHYTFYPSHYAHTSLNWQNKWKYLQHHLKIRVQFDVLSINYLDFQNYLSQMYPAELEIKRTTESNVNISASYLDLLLPSGRTVSCALSVMINVTILTSI